VTAVANTKLFFAGPSVRCEVLLARFAFARGTRTALAFDDRWPAVVRFFDLGAFACDAALRCAGFVLFALDVLTFRFAGVDFCFDFFFFVLVPLATMFLLPIGNWLLGGPSLHPITTIWRAPMTTSRINAIAWQQAPQTLRSIFIKLGMPLP
jgi:hypothetical protein